MKVRHDFERLESEDVISVYSAQFLVNNRTFMVSELISALMIIMRERGGGLTEEQERWFKEGVDCKILKPSAKSWERGKIKINLEFCPEELEVAEISHNGESQVSKANSPLDDMCQKIPKDN